MITKLKLEINRAGYFQKHLADLLKIDHGLFSKMVSGDRPIPKEKLNELAKLLGVKVEKLDGVVE